MSTLWQSAALLLTAVSLSILAFPPLAVWPCACAMLAPIVFFAEGRRPGHVFGFVWLYHSAMALVIVRSLLHALIVEYQVSALNAWIFTLLLVLGYSLVPAAAGALYAALRPRAATLAAPLLFASLWMLSEWLRAVPLALPWVLSAHPLAPVPAALQLADLGGTYAVGFVVCLVNAGLGLALARRSFSPLLVPLAVVAAAGLYGGCRMHRVEASAAELQAAQPLRLPLQVGIIQAAIPQSERFQPGSTYRNTLRHVALTRELASRSPLDLVVWSETSVDDDLDSLPQLRTTLAELSDSLGAGLVTGAPRTVDGRYSNAVVLFLPGRGLAASYEKQRLVPFSEYDPPLTRFLGPLLAQLKKGPSYLPGKQARVFRSGKVAFAAPICFEITYPALLRDFHLGGAELLLNLSNDAWFGEGGYPEMHLAHAIFRAVEGRVWVVRGTNSGISAVIDPSGRVVESLPLFEEGMIRAEVRPRSGPLPVYARFGDAPVMGFLLLVIAVTLSSSLRRA